jgi:predicted  nucleic acid-binding Zn-ribbon protein
MRLARTALVSVLLLSAAAIPVRAQERSPEELAKSIAARWKTLLGLSDEQTAQFEAAALSTEKKTAQARSAAAGDAAKLQESMAGIFKERKAAVEKILTPDQLKRYEELMAKARKKVADKAAPAAPPKPPA